jgi:hypothetical protein
VARYAESRGGRVPGPRHRRLRGPDRQEPLARRRTPLVPCRERAGRRPGSTAPRHPRGALVPGLRARVDADSQSGWGMAARARRCDAS